MGFGGEVIDYLVRESDPDSVGMELWFGEVFVVVALASSESVAFRCECHARYHHEIYTRG